MTRAAVEAARGLICGRQPGFQPWRDPRAEPAPAPLPASRMVTAWVIMPGFPLKLPCVDGAGHDAVTPG